MAKKITETVANHIIAVYKAMKEDSVERDNYHVYVGRLSDLVAGLSISSTWYSRIFRALYDGGYAVLEDRGGRNKPSTVILLREPTVKELLALTISDQDPIMSTVKRLENIERSLGGVYVVGALREVERRLAAVEKALAARSKGGN